MCCINTQICFYCLFYQTMSDTRYMFALLQVLCLIAFICSSVDWWVPLGQGWAQFVFISALITTLIFFIFHLFNVFSKLPGPWVFIVSVRIHFSFLMLIFFHNSLRNSHLHEYWYLIFIIYSACIFILCETFTVLLRGFCLQTLTKLSMTELYTDQFSNWHF